MVAKKERYGVRRRKKLGNGGGNREREGEQKEKEWRKKREQKRKTGTQNIKGETGKKGTEKEHLQRQRERNWWRRDGITPKFVGAPWSHTATWCNYRPTGRGHRFQESPRQWGTRGGSDLNI